MSMGRSAPGQLPNTPTAQFGPAESTVSYDLIDWTIVEKASAMFDPHMGRADVVLLKFKLATGRNSFLEPTYDVRLVILNTGHVIGDFGKPGSKPTDPGWPGFFMDENIEIQDVTADGVPEILFHSGYQGSGFTRYLRILPLGAADRGHRPANFRRNHRCRLKWLALGRNELIIVSDRKLSPKIPEEYRCHQCPSRFKYDLYARSKQACSFVIYRRVSGAHSYSDGASAIAGDWPLIESRAR